MGEKYGFLIAMLIFAIAVFPVGMDMLMTSLHTEFFMNNSTNMHKLVQQEGGVTESVVNYARMMADYGVQVNFYADGAEIPLQASDPKPVGTKIIMTYELEWEGAFQQPRELVTTNNVTVARR